MTHFTIMCVFVIVFFSAGFAQHSNKALIDEEKRAEWIHSAISQLKNITRPDSLPLLTVKKTVISSNIRLSVRVKEKGWIKLPDAGWICILSSSSHDSPETGDIIIAIDHHHNVYINDGHVCGGIIHFETSELNALKSSDEFFRYFHTDTDKMPWIKLN